MNKTQNKYVYKNININIYKIYIWFSKEIKEIDNCNSGDN